MVAVACRKAKDVGYPHEVWTTRLLAQHAREHGPAAGHVCLRNLAQGTVCKILEHLHPDWKSREDQCHCEERSGPQA